MHGSYCTSRQAHGKPKKAESSKTDCSAALQCAVHRTCYCSYSSWYLSMGWLTTKLIPAPVQHWIVSHKQAWMQAGVLLLTSRTAQQYRAHALHSHNITRLGWATAGGAYAIAVQQRRCICACCSKANSSCIPEGFKVVAALPVG
jgi:roadblock/LC7 domain-containing protein